MISYQNHGLNAFSRLKIKKNQNGFYSNTILDVLSSIVHSNITMYKMDANGVGGGGTGGIEVSLGVHNHH